jgi:hypothetical protein
MSDSQDPLKIIREKILGLEAENHTSWLVVSLLGSSGNGLEDRRRIKERLTAQHPEITVLIPEDDIDSSINPVIAETVVLSGSEVDLVFIHVNSWGTSNEFGQFSQSIEIAPKLRVLVDHRYHPLHINDEGNRGYLSSSYLFFMARYGHVYPVKGTSELFPTPETVVSILSSITTQLRFFQKYLENGGLSHGR